MSKYIYIVKNKINDKRYVGKTIVGVEHRWKKHIVETFNKNLYGYNFAFHRAIRKHGVDNFEFEQIYSDETFDSEITEEELNNYEIYFINKYRTFTGFEDCKGYNMTLGGEGWCGKKGNKQVDVYNKKLEYISTYYSIEETARQLKLQATNVSAVINGRIKSAGGFVFCESGSEPKFIEEHKVRIDLYSLDKIFIRTFESMKETAKFIGTNPTNVFDCCNKKQATCKGYICLYHGDNILNHKEPNIRNKKIDVFNSKTGEFIKTFKSVRETYNELKISSMGVLQRILKSDNHLAGDYLIMYHKNLIE